MIQVSRRHDRDWTTNDEMTFLTHLGTGTHSDIHARLQLSRGELLRRYVSSCSRRTVWDGLNRKRIEAAASRMLRDEIAQEKTVKGHG